MRWYMTGTPTIFSLSVFWKVHAMGVLEHLSKSHQMWENSKTTYATPALLGRAAERRQDEWHRLCLHQTLLFTMHT